MENDGVGPSFWEQHAVRPKTLHDHDQAMEMLADWARTKGCQMRNADGIDDVVRDFSEDCHFRGDQLHV